MVMVLIILLLVVAGLLTVIGSIYIVYSIVRTIVYWVEDKRIEKMQIDPIGDKLAELDKAQEEKCANCPDKDKNCFIDNLTGKCFEPPAPIHEWKFHSKYSSKLYDFLKHPDPDNTEPYEEIALLDEIREAVGAEGETYKQFKYLRDRILEPCIKEINEQTDINVSFEKVLNGKRKVSGVKFSVEIKALDNTEDTETSEDTEDELKENKHDNN